VSSPFISRCMRTSDGVFQKDANSLLNSCYLAAYFTFSGECSIKSVRSFSPSSTREYPLSNESLRRTLTSLCHNVASHLTFCSWWRGYQLPDFAFLHPRLGGHAHTPWLSHPADVISFFCKNLISVICLFQLSGAGPVFFSLRQSRFRVRASFFPQPSLSFESRSCMTSVPRLSSPPVFLSLLRIVCSLGNFT